MVGCIPGAGCDAGPTGLSEHTFPFKLPTLTPAPALARGTPGAAVGTPCEFHPATGSP